MLRAVSEWGQSGDDSHLGRTNPALYVLLIPTLPLLVLCRMGIIPLVQACRCENVYADVLFVLDDHILCITFKILTV